MPVGVPVFADEQAILGRVAHLPQVVVLLALTRNHFLTVLRGTKFPLAGLLKANFVVKSQQKCSQLAVFLFVFPTIFLVAILTQLTQRAKRMGVTQ